MTDLNYYEVLRVTDRMLTDAPLFLNYVFRYTNFIKVCDSNIELKNMCFTLDLNSNSGVHVLIGIDDLDIMCIKFQQDSTEERLIERCRTVHRELRDYERQKWQDFKVLEIE